MLTKAPEKLSCNSDAIVTASYIVQGSALKTGQKTLDFFYIVCLTLTHFFVCTSIAWSFVLFLRKHYIQVPYWLLANIKGLLENLCRFIFESYIMHNL